MRILIIGQCTLHWGRMEFGNIGNYYIIEPLIRELHKAFPEASLATTMQLSEEFCSREHIEVLPMSLYYGWGDKELESSQQELEIAEEYNNTRDLKNRTPYIDEVLKSDLVIDFSGDIWGDNADFLGKNRFLVGLQKDRVAQLLGKKTAMIAGSPGPFNNRDTLAFAKQVYESFDLVTNREPVSTRLLEDQGFDLKNTVTAACPSFTFQGEKDSRVIDQIMEGELSGVGGKLAGFIVCGWNFSEGPFDKWPRSDEEFLPFVEAVESTARKGYTVILMSHSNGFDTPPTIPLTLKHGRDYPIIKRIQEIVIERKNIDISLIAAIDGVYNAWETKSIIGRMDILVSGRVHGAIAGLSQFVPTVILDYGHEPKAHKLLGFAELMGVEEFVANPTDIGDMNKKIDKCINENDRIVSLLKQHMNIIEKDVKQHSLLLKEIVK